MFKLFEVRGGKFTALPDINPKTIWGSILAIIIVVVVTSVSGWLKMDEKDIWKLYNNIIHYFGLKENTPIINDQKKLDAEVESEVDRAIWEYERLTGDYGTPRIPLPRLIEKDPDKALCYTKECQSLGGEMRLCAPWVEDCISKDDK
jgi:hypothetical protein